MPDISEETASTPKPLAMLPVAEIRASIQDRRSAYPIALNGINVRSLHFFEDPDSGRHWRRYVPGGNDTENGIFPLEQARGDMAELQHGGNASHVLSWEFFTTEEYAAAEQKKKDAAEAADKREKARIAALEQARVDAANAAEKIATLEKTDAVVPVSEEEGKKKSGKLKATLDRIGGK